VIGSLMLTRYQNHISTVLVGRHVPPAATHTILGSLGGALAVAKSAGRTTGALLAHAARAAFMSGTEVSLAVGAIVAVGGALLVLARLPSRTAQPSSDPNADHHDRSDQHLPETSAKRHPVTFDLPEAPPAEASLPVETAVPLSGQVLTATPRQASAAARQL